MKRIFAFLISVRDAIRGKTDTNVYYRLSPSAPQDESQKSRDHMDMADMIRSIEAVHWEHGGRTSGNRETYRHELNSKKDLDVMSDEMQDYSTEEQAKHTASTKASGTSLATSSTYDQTEIISFILKPQLDDQGSSACLSWTKEMSRLPPFTLKTFSRQQLQKIDEVLSGLHAYEQNLLWQTIESFGGSASLIWVNRTQVSKFRAIHIRYPSDDGAEMPWFTPFTTLRQSSKR